MVKKLILLIGVMILSLHLFAQHSMYLGLKGGYHASTANLSHTIFASVVPTTQLFGGSGGMIIKYFPKEHFGVQGEVLLVSKGFDQLLTDTNEVFRTSFDYLEIPFLFNLYLGKKKTQYFVNLGPYWSRLINHKITGPENSTSEQLDYRYDDSRDNKSSFGIKLAGGIFREFSFGGLQVDGFFTADISNFLNPVDLSTGVPNNSQNIVFGVSVAYLLPMGKKFGEGE